jgi:hypothetical protein
MQTKHLAALLGREELPGTPEELAILSTRIEALIRLNGEQWVVRHRRQLIKEWEYIVDQAMIRQP